MMRGCGVLFARLWRQHALMLVPMCAGLAIFMFILTRVAPAPGEMGLFQTLIAMIPKSVLAMMGGAIAISSARGIIAFGYIHPFFLAIMTAWVLRTTGGTLAGEIGRGTMDLIASRPVSRAGLVISTWALAIVGIALLATSAWIGTAVGLQIRSLDVTARDVAIVPAMGALMFAAWTSIGLLISASQRDAGSVIAWTSGLIVVSFVVLFLAQVWSPAETIRPFSLFTYFQPQVIVLRGVGTTEIGVLAVVTVAGLAAAIGVFHRRDL
jgi:ABC-type transport system involved in multi-copper enzyme maturation permease subunit